MMKFIAIIIAVIIGLLVYNAGSEAYKQYRHDQAVKKCQSENQAPEWASGVKDWACNQFTN